MTDTQQAEDPVHGVEKHCIQENSIQLAFPCLSLPWQNLMQSDIKILNTVCQSLSNLEDAVSVISSCMLFQDVLLHDFPPEVFLQRPSIVQVLLNNLKNNPPGKVISHVTIQCLRKLTLELIFRVKSFSQSIGIPKEKANDVNDAHSCVKEGAFIQYEPLNIPEYCFLILYEAVRHRDIRLAVHVLKLMASCMNSRLWTWGGSRANIMEQRLLEYLGTQLLHIEATSCTRGQHLEYIRMLSLSVKFIQIIIPVDQGNVLLPANLKRAFLHALFDFSIRTYYYELHGLICTYCKAFSGEEKHIFMKYGAMNNMCNAVKSAIQILKYADDLTPNIFVEEMKKALPALEILAQKSVVSFFFNKCIKKMHKTDPDGEILPSIVEVVLKLLAHPEATIQKETYCCYYEYTKSCLKNVVVHACCQSQDLALIINQDILKEIVMYGMTSTEEQVKYCAYEIMRHLFEGSSYMARELWQAIVECMAPTFSLLLCHAANDSKVGCNVFSLLKSHMKDFPDIAVLKANIMLMYSLDATVREEAVHQVLQLLHFNNPRKSSMSLNICIVDQPGNLPYANFCLPYSQVERLKDIVEVLKLQDANLLVVKAAVHEVSDLLQNRQLHKLFKDIGGLDIIFNLLRNDLVSINVALAENVLDIEEPREVLHIGNLSHWMERRMFKDIYSARCIQMMIFLKGKTNHTSTIDDDKCCIAQSCFTILLMLCTYQCGFCYTLSIERWIYSSILKVLLSSTAIYTKAYHLGIQLLSLLALSEYVVIQPSQVEKSCPVSLPKIMRKSLRLPFQCTVYQQSSCHQIPSLTSFLLEDVLCVKFLRFYWTLEWHKKVHKLNWESLDHLHFLVEVPPGLRITNEDVDYLHSSSMDFCFESTISNLLIHPTEDYIDKSLHEMTMFLELLLLTEGPFSYTLKAIWESHNVAELLVQHIGMIFTSPDSENFVIVRLQFLQLCIECLCQAGCVCLMKRISAAVTKCPLLLQMLKLSSGTVSLKAYSEVAILFKYCCMTECIKISEAADGNWILILDILSANLEHIRKNYLHDIANLEVTITCLCYLIECKEWSTSISNSCQYMAKVMKSIMKVIKYFYKTKKESESFNLSPFMGVGTVRQALLCLSCILNKMTTCQCNENWERACISALGKNRVEVDASFTCILTFWSHNDDIIKTAALEIVSSIVTLSEVCNLLFRQEKYTMPYLYKFLLELVFNKNEPCIVHMHAAVLLAKIAGFCWCREDSQSRDVSFLFKTEWCIPLEEVNFYTSVGNMVEELLEQSEWAEIPQNMLTGKEQTGSFVDVLTGDDVKPDIVHAITCFLFGLLNLNDLQIGVAMKKYSLPQVFIRILGAKKNEVMTVGIMKMCGAVCCLVCRYLQYDAAFVQSGCFTYTCIYNIAMMLNPFFYSIGHLETKHMYFLWNQLFCLLNFLLDDDETMQIIHRVLSVINLDPFLRVVVMASVTNQLSGIRTTILEMLIRLLSSNPMGKQVIKESSCKLKSFLTRQIPATNNANLETVQVITHLLLQLYNFTDVKNKSTLSWHEKTLIVYSLSSVLGNFEKAKLVAFEKGLLKNAFQMMKQIGCHLVLEGAEYPMYENVPALQELDLIITVMINFLYNSQKIRLACLHIGCVNIMHKLWIWLRSSRSLLIKSLKLLCNYTFSCLPACVSLLDPQAFESLLYKVVQLVKYEMDILSSTQEPLVLTLALQILRNTTHSYECRVVLHQIKFLELLKKLNHPSIQRHMYRNDIVLQWLYFLEEYSLYDDTHCNLIKFTGLWSSVLQLSKSHVCQHRISSLNILLNITSYDQACQNMIHSGLFLELINSISSNGSNEEKVIATQIAKSLLQVKCVKENFENSEECHKLKQLLNYLNRKDVMENVRV